MPVPSKMADLFTIAASNSPAGSDLIGNSLDDYLRAGFAILRSTNALASASIAAASTTDLSTADAESVQITGSATINSLGTAVPGLIRECRFAGACTLVNSAAITLPGSSNLTTTAGDVITFRSLGSGNWVLVVSTNGSYLPFLPLSGGTLTGPLGVNGQLSVSASSSESDVILAAGGAAAYRTFLFNNSSSQNAGFTLTDASGNFVGFPIVWNRQTGALTFGYAATFSSSIGATGNITSGGNVTANQNFLSSTTSAVVATASAGTAYMRPNGAASNSGQVTVNSAGTLQSNPTSASAPGGVGTFGVVTGGSYGGGIGLIDGTFNWGIYDTAGTLNFGSATSLGALTSRSTLTTGGVWTAVDFTATSDERLKRKVHPKDVDNRLVDKIELCSWLWKKSKVVGHGVIAQRVLEVAPEYVHTGDDGYLSVDKAGLALDCVIGLAARVRELEGI